MVGTPTPPSEATVEAVRQRLAGHTHRFLSADHNGLRVDIAELAVLVAEIVTEHEHTIGSYGGAA
jgi:hypothetical protein